MRHVPARRGAMAPSQKIAGRCFELLTHMTFHW
jgi:hypothetical protein